MGSSKVILLDETYLSGIVKLTHQLNKERSVKELEDKQCQMFKFDNYKCFGLFEGGELIGVSSGWITVKLYSGKQLEIDNVIVDNGVQSKGWGSLMLNDIEAWALENNCETIELNTYVLNGRSHKFYFNQGYNILGYHFQKKIGE